MVTVTVIQSYSWHLVFPQIKSHFKWFVKNQECKIGSSPLNGEVSPAISDNWRWPRVNWIIPIQFFHWFPNFFANCWLCPNIFFFGFQFPRISALSNRHQSCLRSWSPLPFLLIIFLLITSLSHLGLLQFSFLPCSHHLIWRWLLEIDLTLTITHFFLHFFLSQLLSSPDKEILSKLVIMHYLVRFSLFYALDVWDQPVRNQLLRSHHSTASAHFHINWDIVVNWSSQV